MLKNSKKTIFLKATAIAFLCLVFIVWSLILRIQADYTYNIVWSGFFGYLYKAVWISLALIPLSFIPLAINKKYFIFPIIGIALAFGLYTVMPTEDGEIYKQQDKLYRASLYQDYLKGAMQGDPDDISIIGMYYYYGYGDIEQNYAEAAKWFKQLDPNNPKLKTPKTLTMYSAQEGKMLLGEMYYYGKGVEQNYNLALKWLKLAMEMYGGSMSGNVASKAGLKLADYYFYVEHDYNRAKALYTEHAWMDKTHADKMLLEIKNMKK